MKTITVTILCLLFALQAFAQVDESQKYDESKPQKVYQYSEKGFEPGKTYIITRHDGVEYTGEIVSDDNREICIDTKMLGKIFIPKYEINTIYEIHEESTIAYNAYQAEGPFTTRYSFTTNALPIKKGENYGMLNIYGPEFHLAVSDKLNVGLMSTWIASPLILATKYSFITKETPVHLSFGSLLGTSGYLNNFRGFGGLQWLSITGGDRNRNITFSGGYAYLKTGNLYDYHAPGTYPAENFWNTGTERLESMYHGPIISIAGIFRIGGKASFVFDSMIGRFSYDNYDEEYVYGAQEIVIVSLKKETTTALFLMPGVRFQSNYRKALQICVAGVSAFGEENVSIPLPMVNWFYKF